MHGYTSVTGPTLPFIPYDLQTTYYSQNSLAPLMNLAAATENKTLLTPQPFSEEQ